MNANELRIGNIVNCYGLPHVITASDLLRISNANELGKVIIDLSYIPLTEEWLIRFGFEKIGEIKYSNGRAIISVYKFRNGEISRIELFSMNNWPLSIQITHVHQLQNLYFALTGEELKSTH